jgi:hypothetical protein
MLKICSCIEEAHSIFLQSLGADHSITKKAARSLDRLRKGADVSVRPVAAAAVVAVADAGRVDGRRAAAPLAAASAAGDRVGGVRQGRMRRYCSLSVAM